ncbi:MAG: hypothetical protein AAFO91_10010, partial [Bacteroidota bacterium]
PFELKYLTLSLFIDNFQFQSLNGGVVIIHALLALSRKDKGITDSLSGLIPLAVTTGCLHIKPYI